MVDTSMDGMSERFKLVDPEQTSNDRLKTDVIGGTGLMKLRYLIVTRKREVYPPSTGTMTKSW